MGRNSDPKSAIAKQHTAPDQEETDGQTHFRTPIAALSSAPSATTAASGISSLESTSSNYDSDPSKDAVFAIVVYHAEPIMYLEDTLNALAAQTSPLTQVTVAVAKDFPDSKQAQKHELISDICANLSAASGIDFRCVHTPEAKNFGQSIQAAITQIALPAADNAWLWLLHTDSAPLPDALAQMIKMGSDSRRIAAVGPKQIFWNAHPDGSYDLLAVGIKATRSARRVPEIIPGERDQGQLDRQDDVLAIGSAGSLIRAAVYHELSGFNPSLGPFGDGLEFSRRLHVAGYRVVVCPAARIRHAQLSLRPELTNLIGHTAIPAGTNLDPDARISAQTAAQSFGSRRFAQIFNALLAAPMILLPLFWIGFVLLSFPRALIRCAWRDFTRARGELHAGLKILGYFPNILAGRKNIAKISRSAAGLRDLEATNRDVRKAKRAHREANIEARKMAGMPDPLTLQAQQSLARYQRRGCYLALFTVLLMTAVLFIPYFASGTLSGGQLAGDSATGIKIWHTAMQSWMHTGDGTTNNLDPLWLCYLPFLLLGAPFGATLGLTVTISLYITPIIGVLGAYLFTGHFTRAWLVRYVLAIFWMLAPGFITALHDGRIGPALLHAVLPFLLGLSFEHALATLAGSEFARSHLH
ncbi:glycosyltransferase [Arcanobacterium hippocoleae]|uniref:glycosyltransferase n=1 Tax=Arcanobacterium hippocoleae TaxID=149017 RepID=UPI003342DDC3